MRNLVINNYIIKTPIIDILNTLKSQLTNGKLKDIRLKGENILVTCPHHSDGLESTPACNIYIGEDLGIEYGYFRCFVCNEQGSFIKFVSECFDSSEIFARDWLINNFGINSNEAVYDLDEIPYKQTTKLDKLFKKDIDESYLDQFQSWHPYMEKRKLKAQICEQFKIKYDPKTKCLIFPVWDMYGHFKFITKRSVVTKMFNIPANVSKPVYLLNYIIKNNIKKVVVCESQINALYAWSLGYPAVALFGTGSAEQYEILRKSGITNYILCFDGDAAGDAGAKRFIKALNKTAFIDVVNVPTGKDLNDLSEEEVKKLFAV